MEEKDKHKEVDALLRKIFSGENTNSSYYSLSELFEQRLIYLDITKHHALKILDLDHKILESILTGEAKKVDFITLQKLADFLEIPNEEIISKYVALIRDTHNESITIVRKRSFIVNNFNLPSLKKIGFIESINDFTHIEERINNFFGYNDIFEHSKHKITAAFSTGKRTSNKENLNFWYAAACQSLEKTPNPYEYNRESLMEYFPQIRWNSMNVERGLLTVAQSLFKLGVTVIFLPKFTEDLHIRGATLAHEGKPCIVLTNYTNFYATIWFALIHELYHVLFDWEEIYRENYHISNETNSMKISEEEANNFARQYLFSDEKLKFISEHIDEPLFVKRYAEQNHVHPSIIYNFYCFSKEGESLYGKYNKYMLFNFDSLLEQFNVTAYKKFNSIDTISKERNSNIYNKI